MSFNFETLALHAGQKVDSDTLSRAVPVYRTAAYSFKNAEHAANLFGLKESGYIYTRLNNPTLDILEQRVAALEGGKAAVATASGTSAIFYALINILEHGDEFISASNLYGGSYTMFNDILPQFGIKCRLVDPKDPENFKKAISPKTKAIYVETIGNPGLDVVDFDAIGKIAKEANIPFIVDSTFTTPYLFNPLKHGANIVVHSLTKWIGGHGTGIGGIVVDGGNFNWKDPKFRLYNEPEASYHDLRFAHDLGDANPLAFIMRLRLVPLRNLGACLAPDNGWLFLQGLETLSLRMERHSENALKVAEYLKNHPKVEWVKYPGLKSDSSYKTASKYFTKGFGGMVVFGIKGGAEAGKKFMENLKIFSILANVGDAKSLVIHPATTTHSQLTEKQQIESGIAPELVRLSIGIENIDDIIADIENAFKAIK